MINTMAIGKEAHTLVKENTLCCFKMRQEFEYGFTQLQKVPISTVTYHCVFFPTVVQILVGRLDSCFHTHTKKYMTHIHALIFQKLVKMCVYIRNIKKPV